ncbi:hypothetical protein JXB27_01880 [Candidatus Woesearchaeota archaeon]|nr:hypothetical protein [Candidatus Woesearchaeota archaeon]
MFGWYRELCGEIQHLKRDFLRYINRREHMTLKYMKTIEYQKTDGNKSVETLTKTEEKGLAERMN